MINLLHFTVAPEQKQLLLNGISVSDILAPLGLIIAAFAAYQAAKSAKATAQANVQAVLPILTLKYVQDQGSLTGHVLIKNTGHGQAFNISIPKYKMYLHEPNIPAFNVTTELQLRAIPDDLEPGQERRLASDERESGEPVHGRGFLTMIIVGGSKRLRVPIRYKDIAGNKYITYVETGRNYVRVIRPSRRFKLLEKLRYYLRYEIYYFIKDKRLLLAQVMRRRRARNSPENLPPSSNDSES